MILMQLKFKKKTKKRSKYYDFWQYICTVEDVAHWPDWTAAAQSLII